MVRIGVFHPVSAVGGGEAVCVNVVEALQEDHTVEILTMSGLNIQHLNAIFGTNADPDTPQRQFGLGGSFFNSSWNIAANRLGIGRFVVSLFNRAVRKFDSEYDLIVSTYGEFNFKTSSIQYVHFPNYYTYDSSIIGSNFVKKTYDYVCRLAAGINKQNVTRGTILANSDWTAGVFNQAYGVTPKTVYPPVNISDFDPQPWETREAGFVTIGRIGPDKRVKEIIRTIDKLRQRGHDVHIHIVGNADSREYCREVESMAKNRPGIILEKSVERERLVELICSHKYGIHAMRYEHFGISIAELIAGGAIPFVHNSGGQREVVGELDQLLYENEEDAVGKIQSVIENDTLQHTVRRQLPDVKTKFSASRFRDKIASIVAEHDDIIDKQE